jgi:hypothetical protein
MSRAAIRACLLLGLALALAACSSDSKKNAEADPNILPTNYKQEIVLTLTRTLDDPTNVREAAISEPELRTAGRDQRYTVCVRYNARDAAHRYVGIKERIGYFYAGHLNQLVEAAPEQCAKAAYKPFPELEKICLGSKCD